MNIDSLAGFKRFLATPGATLTLVRHDFVPANHPNHAALFAPRRVAVLKATQVGLEVPGRSEPSWLELKPASGFRFHGDLVTVDLTGNGGFSNAMVYRISITGSQQDSDAAEAHAS